MRKQEIHPELQEFKAVLMKFNQQKDTQNKNNGAYKLMNHLSNENGFLITELNKFNSFSLRGKEATAHINDLHKLTLVLRPIMGIMANCITGHDFEKHVDLLIKKINSLPSFFKNGVLEQIKSFVLTDENKSVTYELLKAQLDYIESLGDTDSASGKDRDDLIISDGRNSK